MKNLSTIYVTILLLVSLNHLLAQKTFLIDFSGETTNFNSLNKELSETKNGGLKKNGMTISTFLEIDNFTNSRLLFGLNGYLRLGNSDSLADFTSALSSFGVGLKYEYRLLQKAVEIIPFGTVNFNFTQLNIYSNTESNTISGISTDYTQYSLNSFPNIIIDFGAYIGFRYASFTNGNFNNHFGIKIGMFASLKDNFRLNLNKTLTTSYNFIGFNIGIYNRF